MRMMTLAVVAAALALASGVFAQNGQTTLPKCMQDAPPFNVAVTDVVVSKVLPFLGASCGIEIRVEGMDGTDAARTAPNIQFRQTKVADVFRFIVQAYALKYSVVDDKTIVVTKQ